MTKSPRANTQIQHVSSFEELVNTPFSGAVNAMCWSRNVKGDFAEIVQLLECPENMALIEPEELRALRLTEQGHLAREIILSDLELLKAHGASPVLNVIKHYERDDALPFFPTDVYSFHVDRSPVPTATFLCTYHGAASEILSNTQAVQKVLIPEVRAELKKLYDGAEEGFEAFLQEHFFDLHYQALPDAQLVRLGLGELWKIAVDHPQSQVLPCLHRAPLEKQGESRLLLIC